jgi:hypothetical protein
MEQTMRIERTKKFLPAIWEEGGGATNTGRAVIVTGPRGEKKRPIYTRTGGHLSNSQHALFVVGVGDIVIKARRHNGDYEIDVLRIERIDDDQATLTQINTYGQGEWEAPNEPYLDAAVSAARKKTCAYHCRSAFYADTSPQNVGREIKKTMEDQNAERANDTDIEPAPDREGSI